MDNVYFLNDIANGEAVAQAMTRGEKVLFRSYRDVENNQYVVTLQAYNTDGTLLGLPCEIRFDNEWINGANGNLGFKTNPYLAVMASAYNFDSNWQEIPDGKYSRIDFKVENIHNTDVMGIYLDQYSSSLKGNETLQLNVESRLYKGKTLPADFELSYQSSDTEVVTVSDTGLITPANSFGSAKVIVTSNYGDYLEFAVTVTVSELELDESRITMRVGDVLKLGYTVEPANSAVTFSSSNRNIATVDEEGNITAVAEGQATIKVKVGAQEVLCVVTVQPAAESTRSCNSSASNIGLMALAAIALFAWTAVRRKVK